MLSRSALSADMEQRTLRWRMRLSSIATSSPLTSLSCSNQNDSIKWPLCQSVVSAPIQFVYRRAGRQAHCGDGPQRRAALCPIEREGERERVTVRQRELRDLEVLRCKSSAITVGAKRRFGARHKSVPAVAQFVSPRSRQIWPGLI